MSKKGGYVIVDLKGQSITAGTPFTLDGVTARLDRAKNKACLLSGFAIGDEEKRDVFVDLQKTEDGYIAFFGQYTITIEDDEVTIADGGILMDNIVDSQGNKRFVEGNGELTSQLPAENLENVYCRWSLSGTHLMVVLSFYNKVDTTVSGENFGANALAIFTLPSYIMDKIIPTYNVGGYRLITARNADYFGANAANPRYGLGKYNGKLTIEIASTQGITFKAGSSNRVQFDILIDSAE